MLKHPESYLEIMSPAKVEEIVNASLDLLEKTGLWVQDKLLWAEILEKAGPGIMAGPDQRLRLKPEKALELIALAPAEWRHEARRPENSRIMGGRNLCVTAGYGCAFITELDGRRREARFEDFLHFTRLSQSLPMMDICSSLPVEPGDVPVPHRAEVITAGLLLNSDKPIMGAVTGAEGAAACFEAAEIILGDLSRARWILGLININSPMRLDERMAGALRIYLKHGQPVIFSPGTFMGVTGPVTLAGSLAQFHADIIGAVALCQLIRPGHPVMFGNGGSFGSDLHTGTPGQGRPENAMGAIIGAQMARRLGMPHRSSLALTCSPAADSQAALEHSFNYLGAWAGGSNFGIHGAGVIDAANSMSYEQFIIDLEIWGYVERLSRQVKTDAEHLALDLIAQAPASFLNQQHTLKHFRQELYLPILGKPRKPGQTVEGLIREHLAKIENEAPALSPIDPAAAAELKKYLASREVPADLLDRYF